MLVPEEDSNETSKSMKYRVSSIMDGLDTHIVTRSTSSRSLQVRLDYGAEIA